MQRGNRIAYSLLNWEQQGQHSSEKKMATTCHNGQGEAETKTQGPESFWVDACMHTNLPRSTRSAQTFDCKKWKFPNSLNEEESVKGERVLSWMKFF